MKTIKERAQQLMEKFLACRTSGERKELSWELAELVEQLANAPEPEPVAWLFHFNNGETNVCLSKEAAAEISKYLEDGETVKPLYTTPPAPSVPDGWKLVPIEPDPEQIHAMRSAFYRVRRGGIGGQTIDAYYQRENAPELAAYSAMLAAAPTPAEAPAPSVTGEELQAAFDRGLKAGNEQNDAQQAEIHRLHDLLAASQTPAEPPADVARDAARLDWLQQQMRRATIRTGATMKLVNAWSIAADGTDLRAAIDAARGEKGKQA